MYGFVRNDGVNQWDFLGLIFDDWNQSVESLESFGVPEEKKMSKADGYALAKYFGDPKVTGCCVKITATNPDAIANANGYFKVSDFWIRDGARNDYNKFDNPFGRGMPRPSVSGMTTINHERNHIAVQLKFYKKLQQHANQLERCYTSTTCAMIASDLVVAYKNWLIRKICG